MIYLTLFLVFLRIGIFNFGGGMAMLPLIFQSIQDFGIMTAGEFSDLVALSQVTPGPIAVNAATYVGFSTAGVPGALAATLGVCLPSFIIVMMVMKFIDRYRSSRIVKGIFDGVRPATVGLIAAAAVFVSEGVLFEGKLVSMDILERGVWYIEPVPFILFVLSFILIAVFKIKPIRIMIIMGVAGALICG